MPNNWVIEKLGNLCEVVRGGSPRPMGDPKYFSGNIPFLKIADVTKVDGKYIYDAETKVNEIGAKKSRLLKKGALVLTNSGTVCVPKFLGVDACIHDGFVSFQNLITGIDCYFLFHYFNYLRPYVIHKHKQGVTQVNLNTEIVKDFDFPFPTLPEQRAIVEKIEQLFSELDSGVENLKKAQAQLKVYRQAVLKWAFEGKLTEEWRKKQKDLPSAETLLAQIKTEREKQAEKTNKKLKPIAPLSKEELAELPKLPKGWGWIRLGLVANVIGGYAFKSSNFDSYGKYQVIRMGNVRPGILRLNESPVFVGGSNETIINKSSLEVNDVVITLTGTRKKRDYGFTTLIKYPNLLLNQRLAAIRFISNYFPKTFLFFSWTVIFKDQFFKYETGNVGQGNVGMSAVTDTYIPLFSLSEQQQIVQEIEERLSVCDILEETIAQSLQKAESLRQSILKKAFADKLLTKTELEEVRKAPDWEPAEKLLERIKKENEKG